MRESGVDNPLEQMYAFLPDLQLMPAASRNCPVMEIDLDMLSGLRVTLC